MVSRLPVLVSKLSTLPSNVVISVVKLPVFVSIESSLPSCEPDIVSKELIRVLCEPVVNSTSFNLCFTEPLSVSKESILVSIVVLSSVSSKRFSEPFKPPFH